MKEIAIAQQFVLRDKGTEPAGSGCLLSESGEGTYLCRCCGTALYRSHDKFESGCGWPNLDDELPGVVARHLDPDGRRTEIVSKQCLTAINELRVGRFCFGVAPSA